MTPEPVDWLGLRVMVKKHSGLELFDMNPFAAAAVLNRIAEMLNPETNTALARLERGKAGRYG